MQTLELYLSLIILYRTLIERARVECQNHWFVYNERMTVESCAQAVSNLAIQFGDSDDDSGTAMSRPFGVAVMFAGKNCYIKFHFEHREFHD